MRSASVPARIAAPARRPRARSVASRSTITGLPSVTASSWTPPESVRTRSARRISERSRADRAAAGRAGRPARAAERGIGVAREDDLDVGARGEPVERGADRRERRAEALAAVAGDEDQLPAGRDPGQGRFDAAAEPGVGVEPASTRWSASMPLLPVTKTSPRSRSAARLSRAAGVGAKCRSAIERDRAPIGFLGEGRARRNRCAGPPRHGRPECRGGRRPARRRARCWCRPGRSPGRAQRRRGSDRAARSPRDERVERLARRHQVEVEIGDDREEIEHLVEQRAVLAGHADQRVDGRLAFRARAGPAPSSRLRAAFRRSTAISCRAPTHSRERLSTSTAFRIVRKRWIS